MKNFAYTFLCLNFSFSLLQGQITSSLQDATRSIENSKEALRVQAKELKDGQAELTLEMHWKTKGHEGILTMKNTEEILEEKKNWNEEQFIQAFKEDFKNGPMGFLVVKEILNGKEVEIVEAFTHEEAIKKAKEEKPKTESGEFLGATPPLNMPLKVFKMKIKFLYKIAGQGVKEIETEVVDSRESTKNLSFYNRCKSRRLRMS